MNLYFIYNLQNLTWVSHMYISLLLILLVIRLHQTTVKYLLDFFFSETDQQMSLVRQLSSAFVTDLVLLN